MVEESQKARERGSSLMEYCLLAALICCVGFISIMIFGGKLKHSLCLIGVELGGPEGSAGAEGEPPCAY